MSTSTAEPDLLDQLIAELVCHPRPGELAGALLGPLLVILLRDLQLARLDAEIEAAASTD